MKFAHRLHRALSSVLYKNGGAIVLPKIAPHWPQRKFLRSLLQRLDIDCVIDVGANVGQYGNELRMIGYDGQIVSFEPAPDCFALLSRRAETDPHWHAVNLALGAQAGAAMFNEMKASVFNSFRLPSAKETDLFSTENAVIRQTEVAVERLDIVLPQLRAKYGFRNIFLKMDTQGFDLQVFSGATAILPEIVAMQSELPVKRIYEDIPSWRDAIAVYEEAGFELSALYPVNPSMAELVEMDCYLVNRAAK
jgi:FkbM family methyltransferase